MIETENLKPLIKLSFGVFIDLNKNSIRGAYLTGFNYNHIELFNDSKISLNDIENLVKETIGESNLKNISNHLCEISRTKFHKYSLDELIKTADGTYFKPFCDIHYLYDCDKKTMCFDLPNENPYFKNVIKPRCDENMLNSFNQKMMKVIETGINEKKEDD